MADDVTKLRNKFLDQVDFIPFYDCWEFRTRRSNGYGYLTLRANKKLSAHRLSYELHFGPFNQALLVLHRCDNPACIRPQHLFLGTHQDNTDDMIAKGRENNGGKGKSNGGGRPRIGLGQSSTETFRLPEELAKDFADACAQTGKSKADVLRTLITKWLRQRRSIARQKNKATTHTT